MSMMSMMSMNNQSGKRQPVPSVSDLFDFDHSQFIALLPFSTLCMFMFMFMCMVSVSVSEQAQAQETSLTVKGNTKYRPVQGKVLVDQNRKENLRSIKKFL
jgi:hypothetical protein